MRPSHLLLWLPVLALAEDQKPLKDKAAAWLDKAKAYISAATPPSPIDAGASKVAALAVEDIRPDNWREKMLPVTADPGKTPEEWMILFSGNTSCYGRCIPVDQAFNQSAAILASDPNSPKLGRVDCDKENIFCTTWSAKIPTIWHFQIPVPVGGQARALSSLHIVPVFPQNVTTQDVVKIHTEKKYLEQEEYTGAYHPIDGWLEQLGLLKPLGFVVWVFGSTPSWIFMIVISFFSKALMGRRSGGIPGGVLKAPAAPGQPAPGAAR